MATTFVVAANASRARVFAQASLKDPLEEVADLVNPEAREREQDFMTDETTAQRSADKSRHSVGRPTTGSDYQPNLTPHQVEARKFAQEIATFLDEAHNAGRFDKLCVVASPEFMGLLRDKLGTRMGKVERVEITKDYTRDSPQQLRERLADQLRPH